MCLMPEVLPCHIPLDTAKMLLNGSYRDDAEFFFFVKSIRCQLTVIHQFLAGEFPYFPSTVIRTLYAHLIISRHHTMMR